VWRVVWLPDLIYSTHVDTQKCRGKGKGHPRTGHEGPEGEQSLTISLILALDEDRWSTPCPSRFTPEKDPVPTV
jgi:hypothetical protein